MEREQSFIEEFNNCPITYALNLISGKWQLPILCVLSQNTVLRYNEIKKKIGGITNMMLTESLKDLEGNGLIIRVQYMEVPPRVEYSLTAAGKSLLPALEQLSRWGAAQMQAKVTHSANQG
ncbi:winged helix-turn-helix transcriptional regulator [Sporomusa aerivorans]|uniref:winged helix-turn-helix transcriptional regulator n=1 Tax=Sporomusa aerivorans TaxID=204936 RepID=UPI003529F7BE